QNVPNPFRSSTTIAFQLPEAGPATLTITDVSGKVVRVLEGEYSAGFHEVELRDLNATGLLYYQLSTPSYTATRRMIRLR
ncbi:MAG: T9SS type A sorting domain-containing protein, partial [Saprospiraceae bacterium]|nr:T9SS type A sorting domain-containing protein [Saprospiraceae bacterium]MCB0628044.1 T9SS type A sorting domain-containing protein [Saprospiraceae bacterium]